MRSRRMRRGSMSQMRKDLNSCSSLSPAQTLSRLITVSSTMFPLGGIATSVTGIICASTLGAVRTTDQIYR